MEEVSNKENDTQMVTSPMKRNQQESVSIPIDLIIEILVKLPAKSISKFICVSKLWYSIIRGKSFTDLFLTRSLTRPCFLLTYHRKKNLFFHTRPSSSSSLHQNSTCITLHPGFNVSPPVRGLLCCNNASKFVICNPSTCQVVDLPNAKTTRTRVSSFLGYDCVGDVYKVLCMTLYNPLYDAPPVVSMEHQVLTLGRGEEWRMIECEKHPHVPATKGLCNDGVVYYGAWSNSDYEKSLIMCFDVRLEEFSVVKLPEGVEIDMNGASELVKYYGKLALANASYFGEIGLWVLVDLEKHEWSNISFVVSHWKEFVAFDYLRCMGTISTGEIIFTIVGYFKHRVVSILYYDPKRDSVGIVEFEGCEFNYDDGCLSSFFLDHVESLMVL